jgi:arylformamidase
MTEYERQRDTRSQTELDAEFTLDTIADIDAVRARRTHAARSCLSRFQVHRNLAYGTADGETSNLFPAQGATGPAPVQLFIHGGFWRSMEAWEFSFLAPGFVPYGAALLAIDYPLIPAVRLADIVESCRRAIGWVYRHANEYGLDAERIFISGNSAGGHLVMELMDRTWTENAGLPKDVIKGGAAISGLYDLAPVAASFQNQFLQLTDDEIAEFSPLRRNLDVGAPVIAAVGGDETGQFLRQTEDMASALDAAMVPVRHMVVPGADHITVVLDALADPGAALNRAVREQMRLSSTS